MSKIHSHCCQLEWTGNLGSGTLDYTSYSRAHTIRASGKSDINGSSDPHFRGEAFLWNPEEMLLASLSACHQLWYLHLCSVNGVCVQSYRDKAESKLALNPDGSGQITEVTLSPNVVISMGDTQKAHQLHTQAHAKCFIARSVNFPVHIRPHIEQISG